MKSNTATAFMITLGCVIISIFTSIIIYSLLPNKESNSYYVKVGDQMSAKIESVKIEKEKLLITTSGDSIAYCIKTTKSTPKTNSLCWNSVVNNRASISIFMGKKYYIWIKDSNDNISNYLIVNSNEYN